MEELENYRFPTNEEDEICLGQEYENGDRSAACSPNYTPVASPTSSPICNSSRDFMSKSKVNAPSPLTTDCSNIPKTHHPKISQIIRNEVGFSLPLPSTPTQESSGFGFSGFEQDSGILPIPGTPTAPSSTSFKFPMPSTPTVEESPKFGKVNGFGQNTGEVSPATKQSLREQEDFLKQEIAGLKQENDKVYEDGESLVRSVQAIQQYIRNLLMRSRLLNEGEEAIQEILGGKEESSLSVNNGETLPKTFIPKDPNTGRRRKSSTCRKVEKWSLRYLQMKSERADLSNEQTNIYREIDRNLDLYDELVVKKDILEQRQFDQQVVVKRAYSDGVLTDKKETKHLKGRIEEEVRESTNDYFMKKIRRRWKRVRRSYTKSWHETNAEVNRMRAFLISGMKKMGKYEKVDIFRMSYEEIQRKLLKAMGTYDFLLDSKAVEKRGFIYWRVGKKKKNDNNNNKKKNKNKKKVEEEDDDEEEEEEEDEEEYVKTGWKTLFKNNSSPFAWKKAYMHISMIYGTVSVYMSEEGYNDLQNKNNNKKKKNKKNENKGLTRCDSISTKMKERKAWKRRESQVMMREEYLVGRWSLQGCVFEKDESNGFFRFLFETPTDGTKIQGTNLKKMKLVGKGVSWRDTNEWFSFFKIIFKEFERLQV